MGEFLKGYAGKMGAWDGMAAGYSRDGDSRGLARARGETNLTMKLSQRRSSAVLAAPEQRYASGTSGPRRVAGSLRREVQSESGHSFGGGFGDADHDADAFGSDDFNAGSLDEDSPVRRRAGLQGGLRLGLLSRVVEGLPRTLWGRIAAGTALFAVLGLGIAGALTARSMLLHDERFVIPSSAAIAIEGNQHVTKAQLLSIFGEDVDRNIFTVSLAERRAELERLPWVEHATVMRLLPDHMRVSIVERTPVAFVRQGGHIGLVDKSGVLMDMVSGTGSSAGARYSFPVVIGIAANDPLSTRLARMKIFGRFTRELDGGGAKISEGLSEVDLSDPEDVKALIPDEHSEVLVHFGDVDFIDRYQKYKAHLAEWRAQYPKLSSVDMRYERQVVLEMQAGSAVPVAGQDAVQAAAAPPKVTPKKDAPTPRPAKAAVTHPVAAHPVVAHPVAAHLVAAHPLTATASPAFQSRVTPAPLLKATPPHLMTAQDVPQAKTALPPTPAAHKVVAKKPVAKRIVAKRVAAKKGPAAKLHPPVVKK
jgi:cell division protein FtsQ